MRMMASAVMFAAMCAVGAAHADEAKPARTQSFLFGLNDGERVDILSHGPLTLFARCDLDRLQSGTVDNIADAVEIVLLSREAGGINSGSGDEVLAGQETILIQFEANPANAAAITSTQGSQFAMSLDGHAILFAALLLGVNTGVSDCFVGGSVVNLKGDIF